MGLTLDEAVAQAAASIQPLVPASEARENAVELCAANPDYNPATDTAP